MNSPPEKKSQLNPFKSSHSHLDEGEVAMSLGLTFQQLLVTSLLDPTIYDQLNRLRDSFNALNSGFDLYLEDNWNDPVVGETHFEYRLRSLRTKDDLGSLGIDIYTNHQDANGVWHLGDYQSSYWCLDKVPGCNQNLTNLNYALLPVDRVLQFLNTHRDNG